MCAYIDITFTHGTGTFVLVCINVCVVYLQFPKVIPYKPTLITWLNNGNNLNYINYEMKNHTIC